MMKLRGIVVGVAVAIVCVIASGIFAQQATGGWHCDNKELKHPNQGLYEEPGSPGCPSGMTVVMTGVKETVASFCMDKYEAALLLEDDAGGSDWSPYHNPGKRKVRAISAQDAIPQ